MKYITRVFIIVTASIYFAFGSVSANLSFTLTHTLDGEANAGSFGNVRPQFGDVNGDGYIDYVTFATGFDSGKGKLYVFYGGPQFDIIPDFTVLGENIKDAIGQQDIEATVKDFNNDGIVDIGFGSFAYISGSRIGRTYLFYGKSALSGNVGAESADRIWTGNTTTTKGTDSINIADLNGDGRKDLVIASAYYETKTGILNIFYGQPDGTFNTTADIAIPGNPANVLFGTNSYTLDFNGDGYDDLISSNYYSVTGGGIIKFYFGGPSFDNVPDIIVSPESLTDWFSRNTITFTDLNHDNLPDLCVGAHRNSAIGTYSGRAYCFLNSDSFRGNILAANASFIVSGKAADDNYGRSLAVGDLNNDGHNDLAVSAYRANGGDGYVDIYMGNGTTFSNTPEKTLRSTDYGETGMLFGVYLGINDIDSNHWGDLFVSRIEETPSLGKVRILEVAHGTPTIRLSNTYTTQKLTGSGIDTTSGYQISRVQWSSSNQILGSWTDCQATDGQFNSNNEPFSCDLTALGLGTKIIYLRTIDQNNVYIPQSLYYQTSVTVDKTPPEPPVITQIGLMKDIPDRDTLFYYFTSTKPKIYGKAEPNSSVIFTLGLHQYKTTATNSGDYTILIDEPELQLGVNNLSYYSQDRAGNASSVKRLTLSINPQYFETVEQTNPAPTPTITTTVIPTASIPAISPIVTENKNNIDILILDQNGKAIANTDIAIGNQKYTTDYAGKIHVLRNDIPTGSIAAEILGKSYAASHNNATITVYMEKSNNTFLICSCFFILLLLIFIFLIFRKRKKENAT